MLTITSTNCNYLNYKPTFKAAEHDYAQIHRELKALGDKIILQDQEVIQIKMAELNFGQKVVQFFRNLFSGSSVNKQAVRCFRNKYGSFCLTQNGLDQYMKIMPELFAAEANIKAYSMEIYKTSGEEQYLASNRATVAICLSKLDLLKSMGEIDTTHGQQHRFKSRYGKFDLTDKGLEQYMNIVPDLEKAIAMVRMLRSTRRRTTSERDNLASNSATVAICLSKMDLLKSMGEIDTTHGQQHRFKGEYGEFDLTDNGLEQYMNIVSDLEKSKAMLEAWHSYRRFKTTYEKNIIAKEEAMTATCSYKLNLLKQLGELPKNV